MSPNEARSIPGGSFTVQYGAPEGHDARLLIARAHDLARERRTLVHVATDSGRIAILADLLAFFAPDIRIIRFPAWDCLPYDRVSPHPEIVAQRISALSTLCTWSEEQARTPRIVLTSVSAALQRVMPRTALHSASLILKSGGNFDPKAFQTFAMRCGYLRVATVHEPGEYAIRGGIVDIFPSGAESPVRIDLFDDTIESLCQFDPENQRSGEKRTHIELLPATEFLLDDPSVNRFRSGYRAAFGTAREDDALYAAVSEKRRCGGLEHWLPLFHESLETIFDYAGNCAVSFDPQVPEACVARHEQIQDFWQARQSLAESMRRKSQKSTDVSLTGGGYQPLPVETLYIGDTEWTDIASGHDPVLLSSFGAPDGSDERVEARRGRDFSDTRKQADTDLFGAVRFHILNQIAAGRKVLISVSSNGAGERLKALLAQASFENVKDCLIWEEVTRLSQGWAGMAVLPLDHGFDAPDLCVLTEQDILGDRMVHAANRKRRRADNFLKEVSALTPGDLVVHMDHGVGRFLGLETLRAGGTVHDCLKVEYAGGDRLYVPVENIDILSRFGADEGNVPLDKMGGAGWQARKAKVKKDLMKIAGQLLEIAAARLLKCADSVTVSDGAWQEFVAKFPWQETEDQERAISEVLEGLAGEHPMDRLVCGDVGFGKTEVAMRAACATAMAGLQVAVAVPTTLLARQHYQNFTHRFSGTRLRVEQLSRLVTPRDAERVRQGLTDGSVQVVIGTHALFGKTLKFARLGLLIVDEEQHFGVKQKEKLKELKENVHVLTLTATPIPRTLQMALTGIREMSLIATPPVDRLAVRTFVLPHDPVVIREALLREHYRGGQSFYVCPRIKDLPELETMLRELTPELRIIAAHGQMSPADLEARMNAFYDGQYDVLLATNIIESGLDIPRANTMIVHRSDLFGLSQLYQLRGRVGRSRLRAHAYLTWPAGMMLSEGAKRRLEVLETLDTLGAGFQLASHDLDIRGAGNLLGEEQSGHIREVGVELYQQMLEEAVAVARSGASAGHEPVQMDRWSPQINLGMSVLIPEGYVEDLNLRMSLYRRLADLENAQDIDAFAVEMIDRFGPLPQEVKNLLEIVAIRHLCRKANIERIDAGPKGAVIGFYKDTPANPEALVRWIASQRGTVRLRPDQKLVVTRDWSKPDARLNDIKLTLGKIGAQY